MVLKQFSRLQLGERGASREEQEEEEETGDVVTDNLGQIGR